MVCPLGSTVTDAWAAALRGESGIAPITRFDTAAFPVRIGGAVRGFDLNTYLPAKEARRMDPFMHYGVAAGVQAAADPGADFERLDRDRCGVVMGAGIGGAGTPQIQTKPLLAAGRGPAPPPFFSGLAPHTRARRPS